jgi:hypothetical protein
MWILLIVWIMFMAKMTAHMPSIATPPMPRMAPAINYPSPPALEQFSSSDRDRHHW